MSNWDVYQKWLDEDQKRRDKINCRYPIIRAFKYTGYDDPEFDMWWYKLSLRTKLRYKLKQWLGI